MKKIIENVKCKYLKIKKVLMSKSKRREALATLETIKKNRNDCILIHYSCESFYDIKDGRTPRITSVALSELGNGQVVSFSIHKVAELNSIHLDDIVDKYDICEEQMLRELFDYFDKKSDKTFIHWNMRDINYGFEALKHRYRVLSKLSEKDVKCDFKKIDLSVVLINLYSAKYAPHPRFAKLLELNKISAKDFLKGEDEAKAFENKEYVKLHQSTLRKVDVMLNILDSAISNKLKTNASFWDIYGWSPQNIFDFSRDNWKGALVFWALAVVISFLLGKYL